MMWPDPKEAVFGILAGFVNDPPDSDFQRGFLAAALVIANEVLGVHATDDLWARADALLNGIDPTYVGALREQAKKKCTPLTVIDGGKGT